MPDDAAASRAPRRKAPAAPAAVLVLLAAAAGAAAPAGAQNLFTVNPGFEAGTSFYGAGFPGPGTNASYTAGFVVTTGAFGFAGTANDQTVAASGKEGDFFGYVGNDPEVGGTGSNAEKNASVETDAGARAAVTAGETYTLSFRAGVDFGAPLAQAGLVFYDNNTAGSYAPLSLSLQPFTIASKPMQAFSTVLTVPAGASFAAFRFVSTAPAQPAGTNSTGGHILDSVSLTAGVAPEPGSLALAGIAVLAAAGGAVSRRRRQRRA